MLSVESVSLLVFKPTCCHEARISSCCCTHSPLTAQGMLNKTSVAGSHPLCCILSRLGSQRIDAIAESNIAAFLSLFLRSRRGERIHKDTQEQLSNKKLWTERATSTHGPASICIGRESGGHLPCLQRLPHWQAAMQQGVAGGIPFSGCQKLHTACAASRATRQPLHMLSARHGRWPRRTGAAIAELRHPAAASVPTPWGPCTRPKRSCRCCRRAKTGARRGAWRWPSGAEQLKVRPHVPPVRRMLWWG